MQQSKRPKAFFRERPWALFSLLALATAVLVVFAGWIFPPGSAAHAGKYLQQVQYQRDTRMVTGQARGMPYPPEQYAVLVLSGRQGDWLKTGTAEDLQLLEADGRFCVYIPEDAKDGKRFCVLLVDKGMRFADWKTARGKAVDSIWNKRTGQ